MGRDALIGPFFAGCLFLGFAGSLICFFPRAIEDGAYSDSSNYELIVGRTEFSI